MPTLKKERRISYALALGLLMFSIAMLMWGYHETTFAIWEHEISLPWLISVYEVSGEVLLVLSIVPIIGLFSMRVERWLERLLESRPTSLFQAMCQFILWILTTWIYILEWTKGLAAVSGNELFSYVVLGFGFIWFYVLVWIFVKPAFQRMVHQLQSRSVT